MTRRTSPPGTTGPPAPRSAADDALATGRPADARGVYAISVAAELVGAGPQTLRLYESRGLIDPARTAGGTRRYSPADLDRVRRISRLLELGLNLAGVAMVLDLEDDNAALRARLPESDPESTRADPLHPL